MPALYQLANPTTEGGEAGNAKAWIDKGDYLHQMDKHVCGLTMLDVRLCSTSVLIYQQQGKVLNFQHPAIKELCIRYYYCKKHSMASLHPEHFEKMVPYEAVALAATIVCKFA